VAAVALDATVGHDTSVASKKDTTAGAKRARETRTELGMAVAPLIGCLLTVVERDRSSRLASRQIGEPTQRGLMHLERPR
jgi:hypothetical protein